MLSLPRASLTEAPRGNARYPGWREVLRTMIEASAATAGASFFPALDGNLPTVVRGEGIFLYDDAGHRFIDAAGGVGCVTAIGHGVAEVVDAIARQLQTLAFVPWTQFQAPPVRDLV